MVSIVASTVVGSEVQVYTKPEDVFRDLESEFAPLKSELLEENRIAECQRRSLNDLKDAIVNAQLKIGEWKAKEYVLKNVDKRMKECQAKAAESREQLSKTHAKLQTLLDHPNHDSQSEVKALLAQHELLETVLGNLSCQSICLSSEMQSRMFELQVLEKEKSAAEAAVAESQKKLPAYEKSYSDAATNFAQVKANVASSVNVRLFLAGIQLAQVENDLKEKQDAIQTMTESNKFIVHLKIVNLQNKVFTLTHKIAFWEYMQKLHDLPKEIVLA